MIAENSVYLYGYTLAYITENIFSVRSRLNIFQVGSTFYLKNCQMSLPAACKCHHFGNKEWLVNSGLDNPTKCENGEEQYY